jgi:hypothetical protein
MLSRLAKKLFRLMNFHPEMGMLIPGPGANVVPNVAFSHRLSGAQCPWPARMQVLSASGAEEVHATGLVRSADRQRPVWALQPTANV